MYQLSVDTIVVERSARLRHQFTSRGFLYASNIAICPMWSVLIIFFFFKQKTAYEITVCWSSDVCSSDLAVEHDPFDTGALRARGEQLADLGRLLGLRARERLLQLLPAGGSDRLARVVVDELGGDADEIGRASCRERVEISGDVVCVRKSQ